MSRVLRKDGAIARRADGSPAWVDAPPRRRAIHDTMAHATPAERRALLWLPPLALALYVLLAVVLP